jgi:hypothetical protein
MIEVTIPKKFHTVKCTVTLVLQDDGSWKTESCEANGYDGKTAMNIARGEADIRTAFGHSRSEALGTELKHTSERIYYGATLDEFLAKAAPEEQPIAPAPVCVF